MRVHERELRHRDVDERVARGRALAEPCAGDEQEIGVAVAPRELRVDADARVADVDRRAGCRRCPGSGTRPSPARCSPRRRRGSRPPPAVSRCRRRRARAVVASSASSARTCASCSAPGWACADAAGGASATVTTSVSMSSGSASATGPGRPGARGPERLLQQLGQALGLVDLRDPLAELRQEAAVVDLLERLAIEHPAADLADQHHQRGRVLEGDVQARTTRWSCRARA